jgi:tetratricopeptide (TPR) repeat protein
LANETKFKVRDDAHEIVATLSEKEILSRIGRGKFSGDEEICSSAKEDWIKLSSHPIFYDAFLRRLYDDQYKSPDAEGVASAPGEPFPKDKTVRDKATRQAELGKTEIAKSKPETDFDNGATGQIPNHENNFENNFNATIHQSVLNELFPDTGAPRVIDERPDAESLGPGRGTSIIPLEADPSPPPDLNRPLDFSDSLKEEENPEVLARQKSRRRRRLILWSSVPALGLVFLFQMGKPPAEVSKAEEPALRADPQVVSESSTKEEKIKTLVEEADRLFENDVYLYYRGAFELYKSALAYDEGNPLLIGRVVLAAARLLPGEKTSQGDTSPLVKLIKDLVVKGRQTDPQFSQFYRAEALVSLYEKNLTDAKKFIENAIDADPTSKENLMISAEVAMAGGDSTGARTQLGVLLKQNVINARAHYDLAQILFSQKDFDLARGELMATLKINPLHPGAYLLLGTINLNQNLRKPALECFESAARLGLLNDPRSASDALVKLALLLEKLEKKKDAGADYAVALSLDPNNKTALENIKNYKSLNEKPEDLSAEIFYQPSYFGDQAENLVRQKKYREAILFMQAYYLSRPDDGLPLVRLGEIYESIASNYDDFRTVVGFYQRAIERDPSLTKAYIKLGLLETEQYNFERGYKLLTQAVALSPEEADPYVAMGKHFYKRQDFNEALNQFLKASHINPNDSEIVYYAGLLRLLYKKDSVKESISYFYRAYTLNPQNYDALVEWLKLKVEDFEKNFAIKFVRNLIEQDPNNANLFWALGEIYATNKEYRRSIDYYHRALDLDNRAGKIRMALADSLQAIGELEKAVAEYRLASFLDRKNSDGFFKAGDLLYQIKSYNEAEEVLKFLVTGCPNYPGSHRLLSKIYQIRQQKDLAVKEMGQEVANNPQNPKFRIEYAELYMDYQKYDDAIGQLTEVTNLPSINKAPEFQLDKVRAYLLLSRCYRSQSKMESAEGAIRLALEIDNNDPELHRELGYVYHDMQRDKEAVDAFQFYLNREPAARDADKIKQIIQQMTIEE